MEFEKLIQTAEKEQQREAAFDHTVRVCAGSGCMSSNAEGLLSAFKEAVNEKGLGKQCQVKGVGCMGLCGAGPIVSVDNDRVLYQEVKLEDAPRIVDCLGATEPLADLYLDNTQPFFTKQVRIVREHAGIINPDRIEEYIAVGGYQALHRVLVEFSPEAVIREITRSGLRGRGGAGFPTGLKWSTVSKAEGTQKYIICNGDEGDPGAFMDRSVMESDPHRVIEGMAIAGYAVGASQGYIYVRAEYPLAVQRLKKAIKQAERDGFLGKQIFDTDFSFEIDIRLGAGAFVCGEETALIASIEGKRGNPRPRPPYPAQSGLWGQPTLINNVETFANIVPIIERGAEWYASIGTESSKGTKIFALSGKINNIGLIEVPMGMTLREIVEEIGGGVPDGKAFKAVQTGGPSGGCIPATHLDVTVDFESLRELGSIMGSGGMIIMDETSSMLEVAHYFMEFCMTESCGKCIPCRVGTAQMVGLLEKIMAGRATDGDLALLAELCEMVSQTSLCGLGQSAPNPVVSTLRYFREEYTALLNAPQPAPAWGERTPAR
ncbi:MAG: NADH-quinone oxidoreductase subunit NuoF [Anaerolineae bacterium]|nr:NADH-quinone oxidoreductase subunit NuoF [Anaerolineae bacterium]